MNVLFAILMNFLSDVLSKIFLHASYKIAITVAYTGIVVAAIYAYVTAYSALTASLALAVPDVVVGVWGWVMPPNINACIFAIFSCVMLRFVTKQYLALLNHRFKAAISN
jgi:hypothetical protein